MTLKEHMKALARVVVFNGALFGSVYGVSRLMGDSYSHAILYAAIGLHFMYGLAIFSLGELSR